MRLRKANTNWHQTRGQKNCKNCTARVQGRVDKKVPFCNTLLANTVDSHVCDMWGKEVA